jgi:hypothetical protein
MTQSGQAKLFAMPRNHSLIFLLSVAIAGCGEKKITPSPPVVKNVLVTSVRVMDAPVQLHEFGRKPGETVVVEGQLGLANGVKVNPSEYPAATPGPSPGRGALTERETQNGAGSGDKEKSSAVQPAPAFLLR